MNNDDDDAAAIKSIGRLVSVTVGTELPYITSIPPPITTLPPPPPPPNPIHTPYIHDNDYSINSNSNYNTSINSDY